MRDLTRFVLIACLALVGCSRGPEVAVLRGDLRALIDSGFSEGLFAIRELSRKGAAPSESGDLYVYYDADLEFLRDYELTSWRGLNLGTLAAVLGATPSGITGFRNQGNLEGDRLSVRGRLLYERSGDGAWERIVDKTAMAPPAPAAVETLEGSGPETVLRSVRELLGHDNAGYRETKDAVVVKQLRQAVAQIDLRLARLDGALPFGTGWPSGSYHLFGDAFSRYAGNNGLPVYNYASQGSVENGVSLQSGRLSFALIQSDVAETLYNGWLSEYLFPQPDLRSMASLWPEAVHILTLEGNGIREYRDLRGKRLAVGSMRSGNRFTTVRIWRESGFATPDVSEIREAGLGESLAALESGQVDAVFVTGAIPDPAIQNLARRRNDLRLVAIDPEVISRLEKDFFAYYDVTAPARTYPGQTEPYRTLGLAALLITNRKTRDEDVERFLDLMVDGADVLSKDFYRAGFISGKTARLGISIPLHPGAERFYERRREAAEVAP
ncbi:MAG: TAXI family TRAP transporter solute-binding subunit [Pseudomonadota bacterium]|nr:TAXI family TRAP transporter solute-binding subunit [Pseudomonadota bacterium]